MTDKEKIEKLVKSQYRFWAIFGTSITVLLLAIALLWGPVVRPWSQERKGMANLAEARYTNMIRKEAASAESEAAKLRAKAIKIVGGVAKEFPEYRSQELIGGFARALEAGKMSQTFYVTTRNNIPILPSLSVDVPEPVVGN